MDDLWGIWTHGEEALIQFHKRANNIHTRIEVDLRYSTESIEFSDTVTSIKDGYIKTNFYCKPMDTHQYLHRTSDHPQTVKKSIPYGVGIRMKRICSNENDYQNHAEKLTGYLTRRGYRGYEKKNNSYIKLKTLTEKNSSNKDMFKWKWLPESRGKAHRVPDPSGIQGIWKKNNSYIKLKTLTEKNSSNKNFSSKSKQKKWKRVPLVVTYSKHLPNIGEIVRRRLPILHRSEKMKVVF